jgi:hypothetical protein
VAARGDELALGAAIEGVLKDQFGARGYGDCGPIRGSPHTWQAVAERAWSLYRPTVVQLEGMG